MKGIELLNELNAEYLKVHEDYEWNFWESYMGDKSKDEDFIETKKKLENFKTDKESSSKILEAYEAESNPDIKKRLGYRKQFFELYQMPEELKGLRDSIMELEQKIDSNRKTRETGYKDPQTGEFVKMSIGVMRSKMMTESDENMRKVYFRWSSETLTDDVEDLVNLVSMRNEYARKLWFKHFYDYKTQLEERMDCEDIWKIFDDLREGAQWSFDYIRELEKTMTGLRDPWNSSYMLSGDYIKREDPYFQIEDSLERRGRSMMNNWVDYNGCEMQLDLLEREGKYQNGFCHMPSPHYSNHGKSNVTKVNFTCDNKPGVVGEGSDLHVTLFHEWGHAAHFANMAYEDVILNVEYPPASTSWAETQSMFMDTMFSSIERKTRYADYPFELYEEKMKKLWPLSAKGIMGIALIVDFERKLYTAENLTKESVIEYAKEVSDKYLDMSEPYLFSLLPVHIYSRESSCSYGLAILWLSQARKYFYDKYEYIVDNPKVGEEMIKWRQVWSSLSFNECMKGLTWENVSANAYLENINRTIDQVIQDAKQRIARLKEVPQTTQRIDINAKITIVDGKETICDNTNSFEEMSEKFKSRIQTKKE